MKIRTLPIVIFVMASFVLYKGTELVSNQAFASTPEQLENIAPASGAPEKKEEAPKEEGGHGEAAAEGDAKKEEEKPTIRVYQERPGEQPLLYTKSEKEFLEKLNARREELTKWESELELKQNLVEASAKKLDEKLVKLEELKTNTEKLLSEYKVQENTKLKGLVKIYESMKPKQAAAVFDKMDMDIMLDLVDLMAEKKAAPILAQMSPEKAKDATEELAKRRSLAQNTVD